MQCTEKVAFSKKWMALNVRAKWRKRGVILRIYRCPLCKLYHLTSKDRRDEYS